MNATNFTDIDDLVPVLEIENEDEPVFVSFIESSLLKVIPKFFKAIVTLLISGLLLGVTFLLITLWKRGCRTHRKLEEDKATNGSAGSPLHSVVVTPPNDDDIDDPSVDDASKSALPSSSSVQPVRAKYMKVPIPKQTYLRRASGPFGSEALSFAVEQYTMKNLEKEVHLHHGHHHHGHGHHPHHQPIRSGASAGGNSSVEVEQGSSDTKSKWNCFKGSKE